MNLILGIKKGDIYNAKTLNTKLGKEVTAEGGDISNLYQDDGYLFFQVDPIETAVYNDTIDYEIRLREGPQATIKNITISGNEKTKEHVIRREIRTLPGEKFSRSDLIRSNREIAQLGYFNQEKIGINPVPNPEDGTVDINTLLKKDLRISWNFLQVGVVVLVLPVRSVYRSITFQSIISGIRKRGIRYQRVMVKSLVFVFSRTDVLISLIISHSLSHG